MIYISMLLVVFGIFMCWLPSALYFRQFSGSIGLSEIPITIMAIIVVAYLLGIVQTLVDRRKK